MPNRNLELDPTIINSMKMAACDSFADNIKMIDINKIKACSDNFFSLNDIDILAEDIERQGLKHNLVINEDADEKGAFWIKSGHRRFEAIKLLVDEGRLSVKTVPCFVDGVKSRCENMLDLIMLNATAREMNDSEKYQQYTILEKTFNELEADGKKIKGRMREKIATALNVSPSQVSKVENIKKNAISEIQTAVESGEMSISTANEVAGLDENVQKEIVDETPVNEITHKSVKEKNKTKPKRLCPHCGEEI
jgi:ParB family chromosome partitioning protein